MIGFFLYICCGNIWLLRSHARTQEGALLSSGLALTPSPGLTSRHAYASQLLSCRTCPSLWRLGVSRPSQMSRLLVISMEPCAAWRLCRFKHFPLRKILSMLCVNTQHMTQQKFEVECAWKCESHIGSWKPRARVCERPRRDDIIDGMQLTAERYTGTPSRQAHDGPSPLSIQEAHPKRLSALLSRTRFWESVLRPR